MLFIAPFLTELSINRWLYAILLYETNIPIRKLMSFLVSHDSQYGSKRCVMFDSYEMETVDHIISRCPAFAIRMHDMFCKLRFGSVSENVIMPVLCGGIVVSKV